MNVAVDNSMAKARMQLKAKPGECAKKLQLKGEKYNKIKEKRRLLPGH